jgi:hypothetical protein
MLSSLCRFESQASSFYLCLEPSWFLFWEKFTLSQLLWCSANLILPLLCWQYNCCLCFSCTGLKLCGFHITNTWVGNKEMNELMCMHMWRAWCSALCWLKGTLRWVGQSLPVFHFCHSVLFMTALVYGGHVYVCAHIICAHLSVHMHKGEEADQGTNLILWIWVVISQMMTISEQTLLRR